ncbi:MAG: hypothetical protein ABS81_01900 [Pseudonocardia sp. SCN 72-86]|nr:MAG: hypothetical protein ABS81_01900 [Pseudonocardia sp. SCN 72-86]
MDSTLLKGLRVLEELMRSPAPRRARELSDQLQLTRSNVHRTLQTLIAAGYVRAAAGSGYEPTLKVAELAGLVTSRLDVRRRAHGPIRQLARTSGQTTHLATLEGSEVVFLDQAEGTDPVRVRPVIGGRAPASCVASGKALLSRADAAQVVEVLDVGLAARTSASITDPEVLARDLARARDTGCAVSSGEWRYDLAGIAAVVLDAAGRAIAAVGLSGPVDVVLDRETEFREAVLATARRVSCDMGSTGYTLATESDGYGPMEKENIR